VDVLIVLAENEQPEKLSGEPRTLSALAFDIGLKYSVVITPYVKTKKSFESRQDHPFLQNVLREGRSFQRGHLDG
jgi:hypothetical protein